MEQKSTEQSKVKKSIYTKDSAQNKTADLSKYMKDYYKNNKKKCELCGLNINVYAFSRHEKTKRHQWNLSKKNEQKFLEVIEERIFPFDFDDGAWESYMAKLELSSDTDISFS